MDLLAILLAITLDQTGHRPGRRLSPVLLERLCRRHGSAGLAVLALAVASIHAALHQITPFLALPFAIAVLAASLGLGEMTRRVRDYLDMRERGNEEGARYGAAALLGREVYSGGGRLTREVLAGVLVEGHIRGAGVLFWFLLLGPGGALLYALAQDMARPDCPLGTAGATAPRRWVQWLDWLPARLTALAYGVAGSFTHTVAAWRTLAMGRETPPAELLVATGSAALLLETGPGGDPLNGVPVRVQDDAVDAARALVMRALLVWVTVIALVTLGGWVA